MRSQPPGPVPARSTQRRRRNRTWIDRVQIAEAVTPGPVRPPMSGKGSSLEAWRSYALAIGHQVPADVTRADVIAIVDAGASIEDGWHPLARDWYRSLAESGQATFYEPSDWQTARILAEVLSRALSGRKITAALVERWQHGATELLTTEGVRRRLRLELVRPAPVDGSGEPAQFEEWRRRLRGEPEPTT